jgi:hypothetical protein
MTLKALSIHKSNVIDRTSSRKGIGPLHHIVGSLADYVFVIADTMSILVPEDSNRQLVVGSEEDRGMWIVVADAIDPLEIVVEENLALFGHVRRMSDMNPNAPAVHVAKHRVDYDLDFRNQLDFRRQGFIYAPAPLRKFGACV